MKRGFEIEDLAAHADRRRSDLPQVKPVRQQKAGSLALSGWRRLGVRLVLSRAKRRAKQVR